MFRTTTPHSRHRSLILLGLAVGFFVLEAVVRQKRRRSARALPDHERLPTRAMPPAPLAVLLASVAGEEDPGAAVDAPAVSPPPAQTPSPRPGAEPDL